MIRQEELSDNVYTVGVHCKPTQLGGEGLISMKNGEEGLVTRPVRLAEEVPVPHHMAYPHPVNLEEKFFMRKIERTKG
jgi:hypothetical protein